MKYRNQILTLITIILFFTGCEKIEIGKSFDSVVNYKWRVDSNLSFIIDRVNDYRCPTDVICVWAGDVDIHIKVFDSGSQIDTLLNLYNPKRNPINLAGYSFKVNEVKPDPLSTHVIPQKDFKINMTVTKL